ncbi:MAG: 1-deoxy-D-xylulose-5-phosphate reductoisomerase [Candidatus Rokubacteria bacterium]|nr:1-deoxy-D-xylulose-5-phosphate reductoisomerase [Candidatus Rokubacteria bacterium]MBI2554117.1 1-deoxy-D-xylulose-5-phosphate reductoisomerase [Candidatus Rokubacteria bacterium]
MKRITLLGATGSVGRRALELVSAFPDALRVEGLAARGSNVALLAELCLRHKPKAVALLEAAAVDALARLLPHPRPELLSGPKGLVTLAAEADADVVLSALVGSAGLLPTMAAIEAGRTIALANKETLVMAGRLMTTAAQARKVSLLPVDSEHSAIFQCLQGHNRSEVRRILLTASGGPFRQLSRDALAHVTVADALKHPTWKMGAKITVDSATLMNKGLEIIEARWLFDLLPEQVEVVVHPQSIVHSMVEYIDGSVIAHLGVADMGIPILYALTYPERRPCPAPALNLTEVGQLTFHEPDTEKFPCLRLARQALLRGGSAPVVLNAANEVAVAAFLESRIRFAQIAELIAEALERAPARELSSIEECVAVDRETRRAAEETLRHQSVGAAGAR